MTRRTEHRLLERNGAGLRALDYFVDEDSRPPKQVWKVRTMREQASGFGITRSTPCRRQALLRCLCDDEIASSVDRAGTGYHHRLRAELIITTIRS